MKFTVTGAIFEWRGPAPFLFVAIPESVSRDIKALSQLVSYGWGVIPVTATLGETTWTTSLFPKKRPIPHPHQSARAKSRTGRGR